MTELQTYAMILFSGLSLLLLFLMFREPRKQIEDDRDIHSWDSGPWLGGGDI